MTGQQRAAFRQLPGMKLVGESSERKRTLLVRIDDKLFELSPAGLLSRLTRY